MIPRKVKVGTDPSFSPDSTILVTASASAAHIWDVSTGELRHKFKVLPNCSHVAFAPTGDRIAVKSTSGRIAVYALDGNLLMDAKNQKEGEGCCPLWSADGAALLDGSWNRGLRWRDSRSGVILREATTDMVTSVSFLPGRQMASIEVVKGDRPTTWLVLRDAQTLDIIERFPFDGYRLGAGVAPEGHTVWSVRNSRKGRHLDLLTLDLKLVKTITMHPDAGGDAVAFSPTGDEMTICDRPGAITRLRLPDLAEIETTEIKYPSAAAFSPNGRILFLGGWSGGSITYL